MERRIDSCQRSAGLAVAVFILLSATGDCLQCYWCGPRAEQVHRSQRAPSCDGGPEQVTTCDPGYTHCAVVATSPPFAESRHCVKFYQDECFVQYCNSTRRFRMTCPCRGDLCNGPNTDRETNAFETLAGIVANARIKRNAITSSSFVSAAKANVNLVENDNQEDKAEVNETINESNEVKENKQATAGPDNSYNNSPMNDTEMTTPEPPPDAVIPVEITTEIVKEIPVAMEVISTAESLKLEVTTTKEPETTIKTEETVKVEVNELVSHEVKPSLQMPTAEALQQNASLFEKTMELTTGPSPLTTMADNFQGTTMPNKTKNHSTVVSISTSLLLISLMLNFSA